MKNKIKLLGHWLKCRWELSFSWGLEAQATKLRYLGKKEELGFITESEKEWRQAVFDLHNPLLNPENVALLESYRNNHFRDLQPSSDKKEKIKIKTPEEEFDTKKYYNQSQLR